MTSCDGVLCFAQSPVGITREAADTRPTIGKFILGGTKIHFANDLDSFATKSLCTGLTPIDAVTSPRGNTSRHW